jgi:hypothetical protein
LQEQPSHTDTPQCSTPAQQHEEGGADEVIVDGLHGLLTDPQTARAHKESHQLGGDDELDLTGMYGILSSPQPIEPHAAHHMVGGDDKIDVEGLSGLLNDHQKPLSHGNEAHNPSFATETEFSNHISNETPHNSTSNLEYVRNKGASYGYAPLNKDKLVPIESLGTYPPGIREGSALRIDSTLSI